MSPGQPMPMNGASLGRPSRPARSRSLSIVGEALDGVVALAASSSRWRQSSNVHDVRPSKGPAPSSGSSSTMPARMLVPPMSTARMPSWPAKIQAGARWAAPMRPASSGWWRIGTSSMSTPSALSSTAARPIASSPTRLSRKPPPTTMRSVSRQPLRRRKRRITSASSWAKSSIAPWTTPAASGSPSTRSLSSFFFEISSARRLAERVVADLAAAARANRRGSRGRRGCSRGRRRSPPCRAARHCSCRRRPTAGDRPRARFRWRRGLMRARRGSGAGNTTPTATLGPRAPFRPLPPAVVEADADAVVLGIVQRHLVAEPAFP